MHRSFIRAVLVLGALAALTGGCSSTTSTTPPTSPSGNTVTEPPFQGMLTVNGAMTFPFVTTSAGTVTATLAELDPDPDGSVVVGLALGTWNGTACDLLITNDSATVGAQVVGNVAASATLCARIYDIGKLTAPVTFTVNVVHQ